MTTHFCYLFYFSALRVYYSGPPNRLHARACPAAVRGPDANPTEPTQSRALDVKRPWDFAHNRWQHQQIWSRTTQIIAQISDKKTQTSGQIPSIGGQIPRIGRFDFPTNGSSGDARAPHVFLNKNALCYLFYFHALRVCYSGPPSSLTVFFCSTIVLLRVVFFLAPGQLAISLLTGCARAHAPPPFEGPTQTQQSRQSRALDVKWPWDLGQNRGRRSKIWS